MQQAGLALFAIPGSTLDLDNHKLRNHFYDQILFVYLVNKQSIQTALGL
jgi:hypothetical protein